MLAIVYHHDVEYPFIGRVLTPDSMDSPTQRLGGRPSTDSFQELLADMEFQEELGQFADPPEQIRGSSRNRSNTDDTAGSQGVDEDQQHRVESEPEPNLGDNTLDTDQKPLNQLQYDTKRSFSSDEPSERSRPPPRGARRARGRRKYGGPETAQQRAHRRFYERKKEKVRGHERILDLPPEVGGFAESPP